MSLTTRRALNSVHPWVSDRIRYILDYADNWRPVYSITSGLRTAQEQWALVQNRNVIAARVGCSQHQYGLAADVKFERDDWQSWYLDSARRLGLSTVSGDPVHVQAYPGTPFRSYVESQGWCPDTSFGPQFEPWPVRPASYIDQRCGVGTFATSVLCDDQGCTCYGGHYGPAVSEFE